MERGRLPKASAGSDISSSSSSEARAARKSGSSEEKFDQLKRMLEATSKSLDVAAALQKELDDANAKIAQLETSLQERDKLLAIIRGLEVELAGAYAEEEVTEMRRLIREQEEELKRLRAELEETRAIRERVKEVALVEREKELLRREALDRQEQLFKVETTLASLKRESSMQSMELTSKCGAAEREALELKREIERAFRFGLLLGGVRSGAPTALWSRMRCRKLIIL